MEGYGRYNPARFLDWCKRLLNRSQTQRFDRKIRRISELEEERHDLAANQQTLPETLRRELNELTWQRVEQFPTRRASVLPTAFGNVIRAFETYPYKMYGIEGTRGWTRLLAVIPKDYRDLIDDGKAQMDFWVNLWAVSLLYAAAYFIYGVLVGPWELLWTTVPALALALIASSAATKAAVGWGSLVRASFDLFLPDLRIKLELPVPPSVRDEREQWNRFSKAFLYANDEAVHNRSREDSEST
jgi:hypothetical protein